MGKSKPKMEVTEYYMSDHLGVCNGPVDALLALIVKEKAAWTGSVTAQGDFAINNPNFFGGIKKEGGLGGTVTFLPGHSDQVLPDNLAVKLDRSSGADCPGFRGLASLFFTGANGGFYWTANSPYLPGVWATVRRILMRADGSEQWYPEKAVITPADVALALGTPVPLNIAANSFTAGNTASGGITLTMTSSDFLVITKPRAAASGGLLTWDGWSAWASDGSTSPSPPPVVGQTWDNHFRVYGSNGGAETLLWSGSGLSSNLYLTEDDAWDAINALLPMQFTGYTQYRITCPTDPHLGDNRHGLSLLAQKGSPTGGDMNPAHIVHECLTDTSWGMGAPLTAVDDTSFRAAADTLYDEGFGLSMMWTRQAAIEDFISEILDHIQAVLYVDPATGLLTLKLIRDDYDPDTLPELNPDNCDVTKFDRKLWGEIINEIIVTWTNPENEQEETVTAQDLASIAMQGGNVVSASRNYYGVRSASLATQLARRDLRTVGAPLASCEVEIDRSAYAIRPAACYKMAWPEHGLNGAVMRVMSVDYGRPGDMTIRAVLMEDVFSLDAGAYVEPEGSGWVDPSSAPEPITEARVITLPTFLAAEAVAQVGGSEPVYPEAVAGILATTDNTDTFAYDLYTQLPLPDGSLQWSSVGTNNIIGRGALAADLVAEAATTGVTMTDFTGQTLPSQGGFVLIGAASDDETAMEVAMVTAVDSGTGEISLARGVMDTVPRAWATGTHIWFVDGETLYEDRQVRSAGETVEYKLLSQTSQGQLALESAPTLSGTMTERPWLPLRPANVTAHGGAWSSETAYIDARDRVDPWVTVTWSNRNRLTEDSQILLWTDASVTPETGQTTTIEVCASDGTLLVTHDGLTGSSFDVPDADFGAEVFVEVRVYSARTDADGDFVSLQYFSHWLLVNADTRFTEDGAVRYTEDGEVRLMED